MGSLHPFQCDQFDWWEYQHRLPNPPGTTHWRSSPFLGAFQTELIIVCLLLWSRPKVRKQAFYDKHIYVCKLLYHLTTDFFIMKLTTKHKLFIILGLLVAFMMATNPSREDFANFKGYTPIEIAKQYIMIRRDKNYFVCSIYSESNTKYLGILGNFFPIKWVLFLGLPEDVHSRKELDWPVVSAGPKV